MPGGLSQLSAQLLISVHVSIAPQKCTQFFFFFFFANSSAISPLSGISVLGRCHPFLAICLHLVCQLELEHLLARAVPLAPLLPKDNLGTGTALRPSSVAAEAEALRCSGYLFFILEQSPRAAITKPLTGPLSDLLSVGWS